MNYWAMYYYVYDQFVQDPKHERDLALVETRLTDLGIAGKIARLALFRDPKELIHDEIRKGVKTIVAVGDDVTLRKVIDAAGDAKVAIGMIPLGKERGELASILGIPAGMDACDILSARIIEQLDTAEVNGKRFLHRLIVPGAPRVQICVERGYRMTVSRKCSIEVRNLAMAQEDVDAANPVDGKVECVVRVPSRGFFKKQKMHTSVVPAEQFDITFESSVTCLADGETFEADHLEIKTIHNALRMITGKGRMF